MQKSYYATPRYFIPGSPSGTQPFLFWPPPFTSDYDQPGARAPATGSSPSSSGGVSRASILTPAIVASIALIGSAILLVSYYRVFAKYCSAWQHFWGSRNDRNPDEHVLRLQQEQSMEQGWFITMNSGLDESVVKRIPVYIFRNGEGIVGSHECSVCLGEFEDEDELRVLPKCSHAFHLACIDIWLQSHSNCPLCRAPVVSPRSEALLLPPPELSIGNVEQQPEEEHHQQQEEEEQVLALQIEEPEQETGAESQDTPVLRRSRSLNIEHAHYNYSRKSQRWKVPFLGRSYSTGSNPISFQELLMSYDPSPALILVPNNSAELGKHLSNLEEEDEENYVVLNIEVASTSSSSTELARISSGRQSTLLSVRKSGSFKSSLKRSFSGSRVFSFRRFSRSRSHT